MGWSEDDPRELSLNLYSTNVIEPTYFKENDHRLTSLQNNRFLTEEELQSDEVVIVVDQMLERVNDFMDNSPTGLNVVGNEVTLVLKSNSYTNDMIQTHEYEFEATVVGVLFNRAKEPFHNCVYLSDNAMMISPFENLGSPIFSSPI